jgi:hypothetical protein
LDGAQEIERQHMMGVRKELEHHRLNSKM